MASLLALSVALAGCCAHRFVRPEGPPPPPEALLDQARQHNAGLRGFEVQARARMFADGRWLKSEVELLGRRPGALRFEVVTPTGDTLAVLRTDGQRFTSHQRGDQNCAGGPACAENVARIVPIALPPDALFDALAGQAYTVPEARLDLAWDDCEGAWLLEQRAGAERHLAWFEPGNPLPFRLAVERDGVRVLDLEVGSRELIEGVSFPESLKLELPDREEKVELDFVETYVNGELGDELFDPVCPAGTRFLELQCPQ